MPRETPAQRPTPGRVSRGDGGGERKRNHVTITAPLRDGSYDLFCDACSAAAGTYVWPCLDPPDRVAVESEGGKLPDFCPMCGAVAGTEGHTTGVCTYADGLTITFAGRNSAVRRGSLSQYYYDYLAYGTTPAAYDRVDAAIWADHDIDRCDHDNHDRPRIRKSAIRRATSDYARYRVYGIPDANGDSWTFPRVIPDRWPIGYDFEPFSDRSMDARKPVRRGGQLARKWDGLCRWTGNIARELGELWRLGGLWARELSDARRANNGGNSHRGV